MDYLNCNYESACRKYEEAYSIWRFFQSLNPNWSTEGIDDTKIEEIDWQGTNPFEN